MWFLSGSFVMWCRYHLRDIVVGKIYFLLVRIKIKHMEIAIIKKETSGTRECHAAVQVEGGTVGRVGGRERERQELV